ncbi:MAG: hypothetical protein IPP63_18915 [Chloracidobacterium sp.]|nr:hypothetical protein [Chloracidobacterium sp.]
MSLSGFVSNDGEISSFLHISGKMEEAWTGPIGPNDGLTQLRKGGTINSRQTNAESGNIAQIARVTDPRNFVVTLSFARTIDDVVKEPFRSWIQYAFKDWTTPPKRRPQNLQIMSNAFLLSMNERPITSKPSPRSIPNSRPSSTWPRCS